MLPTIRQQALHEILLDLRRELHFVLLVLLALVQKTSSGECFNIAAMLNASIRKHILFPTFSKAYMSPRFGLLSLDLTS